MRFCNAKCASQGRVAMVAKHVPSEAAHSLASEIHKGSCPKCSGAGPVDIRAAHSIWSAVYLTQWRSTNHIVCRRCGVKQQALAALTSAVFGWWGFPWGLIMTPVQIGKNIAGMAGSHDPSRPSLELIHHARLMLASRALATGELVG